MHASSSPWERVEIIPFTMTNTQPCLYYGPIPQPNPIFIPRNLKINPTLQRGETFSELLRRKDKIGGINDA